MYLLCNICCPKFDSVPPKGGFCLGKWYPGTSYASSKSRYADLDNFLEEHWHNGEEYPVRLEYEVPQEPTPHQRREIIIKKK